MTRAILSVSVDAMRYPGKASAADLIRGVRIDVPAGSFVSILGRSGSGKTTLLRVIAGLERRFAGTVRLAGIDVKGPTRDIQIVFQDNRLLPWKTAKGNIEFALPRTVVQDTVVDDWIAKVGLTKERDSWPKALSGGQEGRVAFARVFIDPPRVLLLDEPFRNLDVIARLELQGVLTSYLGSSATTVIMVSHNIEDALALSDEIYVVTSCPLTVAERVKVPISRPRERNSELLRAMEAELEAALKRQMVLGLGEEILCQI